MVSKVDVAVRVSIYSIFDLFFRDRSRVFVVDGHGVGSTLRLVRMEFIKR